MCVSVCVCVCVLVDVDCRLLYVAVSHVYVVWVCMLLSTNMVCCVVVLSMWRIHIIVYITYVRVCVCDALTPLRR